MLARVRCGCVCVYMICIEDHNTQFTHKIRTFCLVLITSQGHLRIRTQFKCLNIIKM